MTYTEYAATLAGLTVAGVRKRYSAPPAQLSSAQTPVMWPRLPQGSAGAAAMTGETGLMECRCDLVIAVEPVGQGTQPANYARCLELLDALHAALAAQALLGEVDGWSVRLDGELVGDTAYWVIVATVTGSG